MLRIDREWCPMVDDLIIADKTEKELMKLREELLCEISLLFQHLKSMFFMNDELY